MALQPLPRLWKAWRTALGECSALTRVARPSLLPHLREVDTAQLADVRHTLGLDGHEVTTAHAAAYMARRAPKAAAAGWPGPVPPLEVTTAPMRAGSDRAALGAYASAMTHSRLTILDLLQGAEAVTTLAAVYPALRVRCLGLAQCESRGPVPETAVMWDLGGAEENWALRAALLHLAVWRCESPSRGTGRLARLVMNTVRAAAGHPWLTVSAERGPEYESAVSAALDDGDAGLWAALINELDVAPA